MQQDPKDAEQTQNSNSSDSQGQQASASSTDSDWPVADTSRSVEVSKMENWGERQSEVFFNKKELE